MNVICVRGPGSLTFWQGTLYFGYKVEGHGAPEELWVLLLVRDCKSRDSDLGLVGFIIGAANTTAKADKRVCRSQAGFYDEGGGKYLY